MVQRKGLKWLLDGHHEEPAVNVAAPNGLLKIVFVIKAHQLQINAGMLRQKRFGNAGEPLDGNAGERGNAHHAAFKVLQLGNAPGQLTLVVADVADPGQQFGAFAGKVRAAVIAHEQRYAQLALHGADKVADAGLCVAQVVRGLLEAAGFGDVQKRLVLLVRHAYLLPLAVTCEGNVNGKAIRLLLWQELFTCTRCLPAKIRVSLFPCKNCPFYFH